MGRKGRKNKKTEKEVTSHLRGKVLRESWKPPITHEMFPQTLMLGGWVIS